MNKLSIIFVALLLSCTKPEEPTPTPSTFKEDINVRWETSGKSGVKTVSLNDQKEDKWEQANASDNELIVKKWGKNWTELCL